MVHNGVPAKGTECIPAACRNGVTLCSTEPVTVTLQGKEQLIKLLAWANFKMTNTPKATGLFTFLPLPDVISIS